MNEPNHKPLQRIEVLLVDDDEVDIKLTCRALENDRIVNHIHVVHDGVEALEFLRRESRFALAPRPDIIFLDLNMPRMDGRALLRTLKADAHFASIPVIILTTSDAEEDIDSSYAQHANSFITKPVDLKQFKSAIQAIEQYWFAVVKLPPR
jgi:CheY-like chemotaxis protein